MDEGEVPCSSRSSKISMMFFEKRPVGQTLIVGLGSDRRRTQGGYQSGRHRVVRCR
jgi:hypothetical protein